MTARRPLTITVLLLTLAFPALSTDAPEGGGQVQLPLETWREMLDNTRASRRPAPETHALGSAKVAVQVTDDDDRAPRARVQVTLQIEVFEGEWTRVPVLPTGTAVEHVSVDGKPVQLAASPDGLAWTTQRAGSASMLLVYSVDAKRYTGGYALSLPLPAAAAIQLTGSIPGEDLEVSVIPAAGVETQTVQSRTSITATIPSSDGVQLSWRTSTDREPVMDRGVYRGRLEGDALLWDVELAVELFGPAPERLALFPVAATLRSLAVDGIPATVFVENGWFGTVVKGVGRHVVSARLEVNMSESDGLPAAALDVPTLPISRFELELPGNKQVAVTPASTVSSSFDGENTAAVFHLPMTDRVGLTWNEAVPDDLQIELRANAYVVHTLHVAEGVLFARATVDWEVTRGETGLIELTVPEGAQIERVESAAAGLADWRVVSDKDSGARRLQLFFDRPVVGATRFDVRYDLTLRDVDPESGFVLPLLDATSAQRQRGMIALLADSEQTLRPIDDGGATPVGENRLPSAIREELQLKVAHTFRYAEAVPRLHVAVAKPERVPGQFDARLDTLISVGDVTLRGSTSIALNVKSGTLSDLIVELPPDVNVLGVTAPSLRDHRVEADGGQPRLLLEFTREIEGQYRFDVAYEKILADSGSDVAVPMLRMPDAQIEGGHIAVEALSAVEVQATTAEQLTPLDVNELPRQLVLRTTNPIVFAWKYVRSGPPHRLGLALTRHDAVPVQEAMIDEADYATLFTADGLAVTRARYLVRNTRKQFLRIELGPQAEVWSAFVDGRPVKPARDTAGDDGSVASILIKIIHSTDGFPIELVIASPGPPFGRVGQLEGRLPRPDVLVTRTRWNVWLPDGLHYDEPRSNLDVVVRADLRVAASSLSPGESPVGDVLPAANRGGLRPEIPASGAHLSFEKLYANQADQTSWLSVAYASRSGAWLLHLGGLVVTALAWAGGWGAFVSRSRVKRVLSLVLCAGSLMVLIALIVTRGWSPIPSLALSAAFLVAIAASRLLAIRTAAPVVEA